MAAGMGLKILLPFRVFAEVDGVSRILVESRTGSFGLLPHRLDCAAALVPGILIYETPAAGEVYLAVDTGVLVKTGDRVLVSVRNAIGGRSLADLHQAVIREFVARDEQELQVRAVLAKLEGGFIRQFASLRRG